MYRSSPRLEDCTRPNGAVCPLYRGLSVINGFCFFLFQCCLDCHRQSAPHQRSDFRWVGQFPDNVRYTQVDPFHPDIPFPRSAPFNQPTRRMTQRLVGTAVSATRRSSSVRSAIRGAFQWASASSSANELQIREPKTRQWDTQLEIMATLAASCGKRDVRVRVRACVTLPVSN